MDINKETPCIINWVIKYDEVFQMPQFIQGKILGDYLHLKNGQRILVSNVESMDLGRKTIRTADKLDFKLIGPGKRMILLREDDVLKIIDEETKNNSLE